MQTFANQKQQKKLEKYLLFINNNACVEKNKNAQMAAFHMRVP